MANNKNDIFFQNFITCADFSLKAAHMLRETLISFDPLKLREQLDILHNVEHAADQKKHEMKAMLVKAFITPIEREDIMTLSQNIDDVTDCIEDVLLTVYINNVSVLRVDAIPFLDIIIKSCEMLLSTLGEFSDFKKSKTLNEKLISVNSLEEEADKLFITAMRKLHTETNDPLEVLKWRDIYFGLEKCTDACEHVADVIEEILLKNS